MQTIVTELYGIVGMFFTTNERYLFPKASREYYMEYINEVLHGIYPTNFEGIIVRDYFDMKAALKDVEHLYALKKGSVEEDELNILTGLWAKKIQCAIDK